MGLAHVIEPGEREWFRRCRRSWDFGSPNRHNLERREPGADADLVAAVRQAMAVWYFPGMWEWPRPVVQPRALQAFDEAVAGRPASKDAIDTARAMLERYFVWAPTVDAFAPVRIEADFEAGIPNSAAPGTELVDAGGRPIRYHDRVQLLIVDASDVYWVVEHRLVEGGWADPDELRLAERPVAAAWGWEQFYLGIEFAGTVHNELLLAPPEPDAGRVPGDPAAARPLARRPRSRDWARSRAGRSSGAPAGGDPTAAAATAAVEVQEDPGGWFRRTWIRRTRTEVDSVGERLSAEAREMLTPSLALYPSPTPEHCGRCHYRTPCLAMNEGGDVEAVLAAAYRLRDAGGPAEGRLGGGTWSMNRGAAPPPQWRSPRMPPS